jgi:hypothetical protein
MNPVESVGKTKYQLLNCNLPVDYVAGTCVIEKGSHLLI